MNVKRKENKMKDTPDYCSATKCSDAMRKDYSNCKNCEFNTKKKYINKDK